MPNFIAILLYGAWGSFWGKQKEYFAFVLPSITPQPTMGGKR
jgi:hypothetical protein